MRDDCLLTEGARRCGENQSCATCRFNPDVAAKRKAAIREGHKPKPPKPPRMVNFDDVLTAVKGRLEYAKKRLDEESCNGEDYDVRYWAAYRDGVKGVLSVLEQMGGGDDV